MGQSEVVYRPPSEAYSLILRITRGCEHNVCLFCSMYKDRAFEVKPLNSIMGEIDYYKKQNYRANRVFLADGNALCLDNDHLLAILEALNQAFPHLERVASYGSPQDVLNKSQQDLEALRKAGLKMVYMGLESGSDEVLDFMGKGVDSSRVIDAAKALKLAGITISLTAISGLGGRPLSGDHAVQTAHVVNMIQPEYFSLLTLMLEPAAPLYNLWKGGQFELLSSQEVLVETRNLIELLDLQGCVFRSNHASNYLALKGDFPKDKHALLAHLNLAIDQDLIQLRTEAARRL